MTLPFIVRAAVGGLVLGTTALSGGCESIQKAVSQMERPTARVAGARVTGLAVDAVDLEFDIDVSNPYDVALPLTALNYALSSDGAGFLEGVVQPEGSVPVRGSRVIALPATVRPEELMAALSGVRLGDVVPYVATMDLHVDAPGLGDLKLPLRKEGEVPIPAVPQVTLDGMRVDELTLSNVAAVVSLRLGNTNRFPLDLEGLDYTFSLAGKELATATLAQGLSLQPGEEGTLDIPLSFSPSRLGFAAASILGGEAASYDLSGNIRGDSPFGPLTLPLQSSGTVPLRR